MEYENKHINETLSGKKFKRLTAEELRTYKGFENYSDEQAEQTIQSLVNLSIIFFEMFRERMKADANTCKFRKLQSNKITEHDETKIAA